MMLTDKLLAAAAAEVNEAMLRVLPEPGDCTPEFSSRFEQKMRRVLRRGNHPAAYRVMHRAASIVLVLLIGFASILAVSPTVRAGVYEWIRENCWPYMHYEWRDCRNPNNIILRYHIPALDEEYKIVYESHNGGVNFECYENESGMQVYFNYTTKYAIIAHNIVQEGGRIEQVTINGNQADVYIYDAEEESNAIIWSEKNGTVFFISGHFGAEQLIALAESVEPIG